MGTWKRRRSERLTRSSAAAAITVLALAVTVTAEPDFSNPKKWVPLYELSAKVDVSVDAGRYFHGPAMVVAPNGDWLLAHQDSATHSGHDGVIRQVRSRDQGKTWRLDGIVYDGRAGGLFGRNPTYGCTADGVVILIVQIYRPSLEKDPARRHYGGTIDGSVWLTSRDNGKTYRLRGAVDRQVPTRHKGNTGHILRRGGKLLMAGEQLEKDKARSGMNFYSLSTLAGGWEYRGMIFPFAELPRIVGYPSVLLRRDGVLAAYCGGGGLVFERLSRDMGQTWGPIRRLDGLGIRNDPDLEYAGNVLLCHGRGLDKCSAVVFFSPDDGRHWGHPIVLDRYGPWAPDGAYSASLPLGKDGVFIAFSTDARRHKQPIIRGVFLTNVRIRTAGR